MPCLKWIFLWKKTKKSFDKPNTFLQREATLHDQKKCYTGRRPVKCLATRDNDMDPALRRVGLGSVLI